MKDINIKNYRRITKAAAEKAYNRGETIRLCAAKLSPVNIYGMYTDMKKEEYTEVANDGFNTTIARNRNFNTVVSSFTYYNCNNETGRYAAFYIMETDSTNTEDLL